VFLGKKILRGPLFSLNLPMKQIIVLLFLLIVIKTTAQPPFALPPNAQLGKGYAQCLVYDSLHLSESRLGMIPPLGWEAFLLEKRAKNYRFELELPVFDTIEIKIPVDKTTRMANIPDAYGLIEERVLTILATAEWQLREKGNNRCLYANPSDCIILFLNEVPSEYKTIQKRVLTVTAHQRRYDDLDTIVFKQVIEIQALKKKIVEIPPQYEKIFRKTNPHAAYREWAEILCSGCF
jgi:hypothetical protein